MTQNSDNDKNLHVSPDFGGDEDWELIRQVGTGDQAAFERLFRRFYGYLFRFVFQITRRTDCVEEVINETMFVVWEKATQVVPRAKASTWILGIAHNKALQALYHGRRFGSGSPDADDDSLLTMADDNSALLELETEELMFKVLRVLTPEQRAVLELVYYHGLHYSEIAQIIDCPENTVKTRVHHARRKLRALWPGLTGTPVSAGNVSAGSRLP